MLAYKITAPGMVSTKGSSQPFKLHLGMNTTPQANCARNGFHCAENPLDCLSYYSGLAGNEIYMVDAGGDIDEDDRDSKISCTELNVIREITVSEFVAAALLYVRKHPDLPTHHRIKTGNGSTGYDEFVIVKGENPKAMANKINDVLGFIVIENESLKLSVLVADGEKIKVGVYYTADGKAVQNAK